MGSKDKQPIPASNYGDVFSQSSGSELNLPFTSTIAVHVSHVIPLIAKVKGNDPELYGAARRVNHSILAALAEENQSGEEASFPIHPVTQNPATFTIENHLIKALDTLAELYSIAYDKGQNTDTFKAVRGNLLTALIGLLVTDVAPVDTSMPPRYSECSEKQSPKAEETFEHVVQRQQEEFDLNLVAISDSYEIALQHQREAHARELQRQKDTHARELQCQKEAHARELEEKLGAQKKLIETLEWNNRQKEHQMRELYQEIANVRERTTRFTTT